MAGDKKSTLFVNDGSFLEKFKQLQEQQQLAAQQSKEEASKPSNQGQQPKEGTMKQSQPFKLPVTEGSNGAKTNVTGNKGVNLKAAGKPAAPAAGKFAFSLKPISKLITPAVKLDEEEEEEEESNDRKNNADLSAKRQKLEPSFESKSCKGKEDQAPQPPDSEEVKTVADKLAIFVAKNGRQLENITRERNPGETSFKFLFDVNCPDYKYYEFRVSEELRALNQKNQSSNVDSSNSSACPIKDSSYKRTGYQTPASALHDSRYEDSRTSSHRGMQGRQKIEQPPMSDPVAMMEFYAKKAAEEESKRAPKYSKDEMPPPPSLQLSSSQKKGHHMGDYIPQEELERFMAACNDSAAQKALKEASEKAKIQADNVGHKLLSKMGWKEGEGLGSSRSGRADPVEAGRVKTTNLGVGAEVPGEVTPEDDIYEQYKKRMMLGYRYRPNPLNNPRKAYY